MYRAAITILRPFARFWTFVASASWNTIPRPTDATTVHASGADPLRILLLGGGPAVGYGVLSHHLALPGHLARALSVQTGRGVSVTVVSTTTMTASTAIASLGALQLDHFDAVLVTIGMRDALLLAPPGPWAKDMDALLSHLHARGPRHLRSFVMTLYPLPRLRLIGGPATWLANNHEATLNHELAAVLQRHPATTAVALEPVQEDGIRFRTTKTFEGWARQLAAPMGRVLAECVDARGRDLTTDEQRRQLAVKDLGVLDNSPDERLDRIAVMAQQLFDTAAAAISFADGDRQRFTARVGFDLGELARDETFCDQTLRGADAFVVPDASADPRFEKFAVVNDEHHVRFYAGYPIESPDGERIGALCVFDTRPRTFSRADVALLRDFALIAQDHLWATRKAQRVK